VQHITLGVPFTFAGPWPLLLGICQECEFIVVVVVVVVCHYYYY